MMAVYPEKSQNLTIILYNIINKQKTILTILGIGRSDNSAGVLIIPGATTKFCNTEHILFYITCICDHWIIIQSNYLCRFIHFRKIYCNFLHYFHFYQKGVGCTPAVETFRRLMTTFTKTAFVDDNDIF